MVYDYLANWTRIPIWASSFVFWPPAASGVAIDARQSGKWKTGLEGIAIITILVLEIVDTLIQRLNPHLPYWSDLWAYLPYSLTSLVT